MLLIVKIILVVTLGLILFQDLKERQVYWFLFPLVGISCGVLHYFNTLPELFYLSVVMNMIFTTILLLIVFLYTKFKLKIAFIEAFGLGDVLFFLMVSFSFSTISFVILFICALIFSLIVHLTLKKNSNNVPLAGYMSLFFVFTYLAYWSGFINSVYRV
ncbi:hypothetical protein JYT34_00600 [Olleya sp. AH-315-K02]|nr:hypothetical protein [Olleya sp. AH-315-K02]